MPTQKPDYIIAEIWDQIRDLFLSEIDTIPKSDYDSKFLKELLQIYHPLNPYISLSVLSFTWRILKLLWMSENIHGISFCQITGFYSKNDSKKVDKIGEKFLQALQSYEVKDNYHTIYLELYEEILNYVLILPYNSVLEAFKTCTTLIGFKKYLKKYSKTQNLQLKGRYYTPEETARYVVEKSLNDFRFNQNTKILDLCAGTGSFTIHICDTMLQNYLTSRAGLTALMMKRNIVKNHLRTIDIDPIATFILRIRLIHWFLHEAQSPTTSQLSEFTEELRNATKIGNVLSKIPQFDCMFDVIISNPPYVSEKSNKLFIDQMIKSKNSKFYKPRLDYYLHFLAYAFESVNPQGRLGFITPSYFIDTKSATSIREYLHNHTSQIDYYDFQDQVLFTKAPGFHSCVFVCRMDSNLELQQKNVLYHDQFSNVIKPILYSDAFLSHFDYMIKFVPKPDIGPMDDYTQLLGKNTIIRQGAVSGPDRLRKKHLDLMQDSNLGLNQGVFVLSNEDVKKIKLSTVEKSYLLPFCYVRDLEKNSYLSSESFSSKHQIIYLNQLEHDESSISNILRHVEQFSPIMNLRRENQMGKRKWYELHWPRSREMFTMPRILAIRRTSSPRFIYTEIPFVTDLSTNIIIAKNPKSTKKLFEYLISPIVTRWLTYYAKNKGKILQIDKSVLERIPIPKNIT